MTGLPADTVDGIARAATATAATTDDRFLDGRLVIRQPCTGFRAGSDAVFLAAAVPAGSIGRLLDIGAGVGTAGLGTAIRSPGLQVDALELQPRLSGLLAETIALNGLAGRARAIAGDLADPPAALRHGAYQFAITNPPFFEPARSRVSDDPMRRVANTQTMPLDRWIARALAFLRPGGRFAIIQRAERLGEILAALERRAGGVRIVPLWPGDNRSAKRLVVVAIKGSRAKLVVRPGLLLHDAPERYTGEAMAVLRGARDLDPGGEEA